jgi:hypothetical protein
MAKIQLPDVTLIAPTGLHVPETITAIEKCCVGIDFGAVKLVAPEIPENTPDYIVFEKCDEMDSYFNYNNYVFRNLYNHVQTSHCLLIQYDSWIINSELWDNSWLEYDYIGAPWAIKDDAYIAWHSNEHVRVGNGGFSLRSKKLIGIPSLCDLPLTQEQGFYNEDGNVCCYYRVEFLAEGIKYAPVDVAAKFSFETPVEENFGIMPFGFHKNYPRYITG